MTEFARTFFKRQLTNPAALYIIVLGAFLIHLGFIFSQTFSADDYLQRYVFIENTALDQRGITQDNQSLTSTLTNQFNFFDGSEPRFEAQKNYGVLPWWINNDAKLHLFRPITSLTHWVDYKLWPDSLTLMHATSFILLMLAYFLVLALYRSMETPTIALGAFTLFMLDVSMIFPLTWLAARNVILVIICTACSLYFLHRAKNKKSLALSLVFFSASLLSAEAGITAFGFILAYLLILDQRSPKKRIGILMLFLAIIAIWKTGYTLAGFGSTDVGNYLDPLHEPLAFMLQCFTQYPLLLLNSVTGVEGIVGSFYSSLAGFSLTFCLAFACYRIKQRRLWFWFFALLFSLIPYIALPATAPRFTVLSHIATAAIFARLLLTPAKNIVASSSGKLIYRLFLGVIFFLHIIISFLIVTTASLFAATTQLMHYETTNHAYNQFTPDDIAGKHLIILQSADPFRLMFYPYKAAFNQEPLAASIQQLTLATSSLTLHTLSSNHLRIDIPKGLILTGKEIQQQLNKTGKVLHPRNYDFYGFFYQGHYQEKVGNRHPFDAYTLIINAINEKNQVTQVDIHLHYPYNSDQYHWMTWKGVKQGYQPIDLPAVGQQQTFEGLLEQENAW